MIKKIIELVLIVALIVSIYFLGYTKQLHLLINPRYFFFIYGSLTILFIFVIIQILLPLDKQKHKTVDISYILIIIIVILMFSTSYADYQESISEIKGVNLGNKTVYDSNIEATPVQPKKTENISVFNELKIDDSNYYDVIDSLYNNSEIHKGQTITLTGFITNYSDLGSDNFILSRLIMICCAADSWIRILRSLFALTPPARRHVFTLF